MPDVVGLTTANRRRILEAIDAQPATTRPTHPSAWARVRKPFWRSRRATFGVILAVGLIGAMALVSRSSDLPYTPDQDQSETEKRQAPARDASDRRAVTPTLAPSWTPEPVSAWPRFSALPIAQDYGNIDFHYPRVWVLLDQDVQIDGDEGCQLRFMASDGPWFCAHRFEAGTSAEELAARQRGSRLLEERMITVDGHRAIYQEVAGGDGEWHRLVTYVENVPEPKSTRQPSSAPRTGTLVVTLSDDPGQFYPQTKQLYQQVVASYTFPR